MTTNARHGGYKVGDKVLCNGYEGTVVTLCGWSDTLIEVRLASGTCCVGASEVKRATDYEGIRAHLVAIRDSEHVDREFWSNKLAALDIAEKNGWEFSDPR